MGTATVNSDAARIKFDPPLQPSLKPSIFAVDHPRGFGPQSLLYSVEALSLLRRCIVHYSLEISLHIVAGALGLSALAWC